MDDSFNKIWEEEDANADGEVQLDSPETEEGDTIPESLSEVSGESLPPEKENGDMPVSSMDDVLKEDEALLLASSTEEEGNTDHFAGKEEGDAIPEVSEETQPPEKKENEDIPVSSLHDVLKEDVTVPLASSTEEEENTDKSSANNILINDNADDGAQNLSIKADTEDIIPPSSKEDDSNKHAVAATNDKDEESESPSFHSPISKVENNDTQQSRSFSSRLIDELNTIGVMDKDEATMLQLDVRVENEQDDEEDAETNSTDIDPKGVADKPWRSKIWKRENPSTEKSEAAMESPTKSVSDASSMKSPTEKKKKKKKKKKRSSEDEKLFNDMASKICELGKLLVRQRNKTKKAEELLAVSEEDVLFLSRRFQQLQVDEDTETDKEQLSRIVEQQKKHSANANGDDMSNTTTATLLNVKLRETKAKYRIEQQEKQKFEEEVLDLRKRFADSQNHAHDLEQELNFHTAKANELQSLLYEQGGNTSSLLEGIELKTKLTIVENELKQSQDQIEKLELERESNHGLVAELSSIIDPKGLFGDDLSGVLANVRDGVEVNPSKAQELTIQHLTSLLEKSEDDKMKQVEKICSLQEELAMVKEQLEQSQNGYPQKTSPSNRLILSRFRRSPNKSNSPSPNSVVNTQPN